jgi:hypothetical protein
MSSKQASKLNMTPAGAANPKVVKQGPFFVHFKAPDGFKEAEGKVQNHAIAAFVAANPGCTIQPIKGRIAEGGLPTYLRRDSGKRADICRMLAKPIGVNKFLVEARKLGGGYTDLVAALVGGYSRSAVGYGVPIVEIVALPTT